MHDSDYAVVIGISQYPTLKPPAPGSPHDLSGPDADAAAIFDWLTNTEKGGVPESNAIHVSTSKYLPFQTEMFMGQNRILARPCEADMAGCFGWLLQRFQNSNKVHLGRRLYVYFSGHGFAVKDCEGGVYDPQATPNDLRHFYVRSWFDWFYRNAVFAEFVLWVDACSDNIPIGGAIGGTRLPRTQSSNPASGRRFVAFAAKHTLRSVERPNSNGDVRGVFTTALLEGLNGAAVDQSTGRITADSLRRYLKGGMKNFMIDQDRNNPDIDNEPAFGPVEDLDFGAHQATRFTTEIRFDNRFMGAAAEIIDNHFKSLAQTVVAAQPWFVDLPTGFYAVLVAGDRKPFSVTGGQIVAVIVN
jgi:hypothetical protein